MEWNPRKSVLLSQLCLGFFALGLAALDIGAWWIAAWFAEHRLLDPHWGTLMLATLYTGSLFGWPCLYCLWRLLRAVGAGRVFTAANVTLLRRIGWCCLGAAGISLLSGLYYLPFFFVGVAAGFMALIVRIVKNAFEQALAMKDELDYTV